MDQRTYRILRTYCMQHLGGDFSADDIRQRERAEERRGFIGELDFEHDWAMVAHERRDVVDPRKQHAAHLLAVISNHRAFTYDAECGRNPKLEAGADLCGDTRKAVDAYVIAANLPDDEKAMLRRLVVAAEENARPESPGVVRPRGVFKQTIINAPWPLPAGVNLNQTLKKPPKWLVGARIHRGSRGAPHRDPSMWSPVEVAVCLYDRYAPAVARLDAVMRTHFPAYEDEWKEKRAFLT